MKLKKSFIQFLIVSLIYFIIGWSLYTYRILETPPGINGDEAAVGNIAASIAQTGKDPTGKFLPIFTRPDNFTTDWKQPVTVYSEVLAFKLFGTSFFNLRAVSVIFALIGGLIIFLIVKEVLDFKSAVFGLIIYTGIPIVMIQSHLAIENIAPVPFIAFWLLMIVKYSRNMKNKYLILAAVALSLGIFSYLGLRLIVPVLIILSIIFIYYLNKPSKNAISRILIFLLSLTPILILLLVSKNLYPGSLLGQFRPYQVTSYQQLILPFISTFDPSFLFIKGDSTPYHSTGKHGMFLLASLPLFLMGLSKIIQKKQQVLFFILAVFFLMPLLYGLGSDIHRASRLLSLIPSYVVICSLGIMTIINFKNKLWSFLLMSIITFSTVFNFTDFANDYWYEYPKRVQSNFSRPYHKAFEKAKRVSLKENFSPFILNDFYLENPIAVDFFKTAYFSGNLGKWNTGKEVPKQSVIIINSGIPGDQGKYRTEEIDGTDFALLINEAK